MIARRGQGYKDELEKTIWEKIRKYNISTHTIAQNKHHSNQGNPNNATHIEEADNHNNQCIANSSAYK